MLRPLKRESSLPLSLNLKLNRTSLKNFQRRRTVKKLNLIKSLSKLLRPKLKELKLKSNLLLLKNKLARIKKLKKILKIKSTNLNLKLRLRANL
jgi:hypothetical protein